MSEPRKKVLMVMTQLGYGGAETSFIRLANYLAQSMEVTVALFTRDYGRSDYASGHEPLNAPVILLDTPSASNQLIRWLTRIRTLRRLKARHDACVSFLSGPNLVNVLAGHHKKSIVSLRGSRLYDPLAPQWQRRIFQYVLDPFIFLLAARIVPVSVGLVNEICRQAGAAAAKKARVISPFVELESIRARLADPVPESYAALSGQKLIAAAGRLSLEKGFDYLISVFADVAKTHGDAKLLILGDGPMRAELHAQCARLKLRVDDMTPGVASVIFAGYQKNILPLLRLARVFVVSSVTEGFPNAILEAMAANIPVLAADTPWGARAILAPERAGGHEAYPTTAPAEVTGGILMPRIDEPRYFGAWVETVNAQLQRPALPRDTGLSTTLDAYDVRRIGAQWKQLIEEL